MKPRTTCSYSARVEIAAQFVGCCPKGGLEAESGTIWFGTFVFGNSRHCSILPECESGDKGAGVTYQMRSEFSRAQIPKSRTLGAGCESILRASANAILTIRCCRVHTIVLLVE